MGDILIVCTECEVPKNPQEFYDQFGTYQDCFNCRKKTYAKFVVSELDITIKIWILQFGV